MYVPRYYQKKALELTVKFLQEKQGKHGLIVLPTGSGKSYSIADIIKYVLENWPTQILLASHSKEILKQDYDALRELLPDTDIQIYSASLKSKKVGQVTVAGIQSIRNKGHLFQGVRLIIVDEAHLIGPSAESSYMKLFSMLPNAIVIGYTATPFRYKGMLTDADHLFDEIILEVNPYELIQKGYLSKLTTKNTKTLIDRAKLKVVGGDYSRKSMSVEVDRFGLTKAICDDMLLHRDTRKHWLIAAVDIAHAEHIAEYLADNGVAAYAVHSKQNQEERDLIIRLYRAGKLQAVVQVNILSVGFDYPEIDMLGILRPTKSQVFHRQLAGRGLRIAPGKDDCLILDYAGNTKALGPIDINPDISKFKAGGGGEAPTKVCPACDEIVFLSCMVCPDCGHKFESQEKLSVKSSKAPILQGDKPKKTANRYTVEKVFYHKNIKLTAPPTLKVTYKCPGLKRFSEWLHFEGRVASLRNRSNNWWNKRSKRIAPTSVDKALETVSELKQPYMIEVDESGQWPKITKYIFDKENVEWN